MIKNNIKDIINILKFQFNVDKKVALYHIIYSVLLSFTPFLGILLPTIIIDYVISDKKIDLIIVIIFILSFGTAIIDFLKKEVTILQSMYNLKIIHHLKMTLSRKSVEVDYKDIETNDMLNKLNNATNSLYNFATIGSDIIVGLIGLSLKFIGLLYIMSYLDIFLTLIIVLFTIFNYFLNNYSGKKNHEYELSKSEENRKKDYADSLISNIKFGKESRIYNFHEILINKYTESFNIILNIIKNQKKFSFKIDFINELFNNIYIGIIYLFSVYKYSIGNITAGSFLMFINAADEFYATFNTVASSIITLKNVGYYYKDYKEYIEIPNQLRNTKIEEASLKRNNKNNIPPSIEFKKVYFKYPNSDEYILKNISLKIAPYSHITIVGDNGSGKSTFIKLLLRLYDVTDGMILVNGRNIIEYDYDELMLIYSTVFQDFKLFAYTIKENICFDNVVKNDLITKSIANGEFDRKVTELNDGIETFLFKDYEEHGIELSGGEKQKLAIVRALYKNAPIFILDEPTASLDPINEYEIYKNINEIAKGKTVIFISHRLTSSIFSDEIIVFKDGEIIENGKHELLINKNGYYKEIYDKQSKYYT